MEPHLGMLCTAWPHPRDPVAGCFVRAMARALARRGNRVTVVCPWSPGEEPLPEPGVRVVPVPYRPARTFYGPGAPERLRASPAAWLGAGAFALGALGASARAFERCDALVSHFALPSAPIAGLVRAGRPHLAVVHGTDGWLLQRLPAPLRALCFHGATHVQVTHRGLLPAVPGTLPVTVRPMGFDPVPQPVAHGPRDTVTALAVGRLVPVKGVGHTVEAVLSLRARGLPLRLVVLGDGPERPHLEALRARDPEGVSLLGAVSPETRDHWLQRSDLLLHHALALPDGRSEGAPVAILEALGAGLAVLATDSGGVRELLGDAGVVARSPEDFQAALETLVNDFQKRSTLGQCGLSRASGHTWEATAGWLEGVLLGGDRSCSAVGRRLEGCGNEPPPGLRREPPGPRAGA
ncbi:MAG: glycosyltransferase family 4 protein [Deltaproteobacteria bacterium]|nr:glycosyltransferase family 4 protein [Deltaproteobacteria bacterium]